MSIPEAIMESNSAHLEALFVCVLAIHVAIDARQIRSILRSELNFDAIVCITTLLDCLCTADL